MVDEIKGIRDQVLRTVIATITKGRESRSGEGEEAREGEPRMDLWAAKDLLGSVAAWAGKGKDEIVQVLCREIGQAIAAVVKEPLQQVLENRKLQISLELVPKKSEAKDEAAAKPSKTSRSRGKKKS